MEKMEVDDDSVVDLSVSHTHNPNIIVPRRDTSDSNRTRRVLRPRTEPRRYTESPDPTLNGRPRANGTAAIAGCDSDSSEGEMPPLLPIKELSPVEVWQRERNLRRLREELRAEEMKLVLLKKLRQSQQLKENLAVGVPPPTVTATAASVVPSAVLPPTGLPSGLSITPTTVKVPSTKNQPPQAAHSRHSNCKPNSHSQHGVPTPLRGQPPPARQSLQAPPQLSAVRISVPQLPQRNSLSSRSGFPAAVKDLSPAVTITPAPPQPIKQEPPQRSREDTQTPAQRQAAAKLALRKQLEKTLLQIPPPKPPPPEMHFIPNPSNTEFIYLVGLEHVVDFLTKEPRPPAPPTPFQCQQCRIDFTPVWKWEKHAKNRQSNATFQQPMGKDPRVICEQCVTSNVKKALKAEHTNRLKTAFVKALQQEQEIEQRLAQVSCNSPAPSPVAPEPSPSPKATATPVPRHVATPPAPPPAQPTPPPVRSTHSISHSSSHGGSHGASHVGSHGVSHGSSHGGSHGGSHGSSHGGSHSGSHGGSHGSSHGSSHGGSHGGSHGSHGGSHGSSHSGSHGGSHSSHSNSQQSQDKSAAFHQSAAAMQALQQQIFRAPNVKGSSNNKNNQKRNYPEFQRTNPFCHDTYGLSAGAPPSHMLPFSPLFYPYMAMAQAAGAAAASGKSTPNIAELQRAADLQRQYLLDMIPPQAGQSRPNWKT